MSGWRAVLDAQVWVSGAISAQGPARAIIAAARAGRFRIVTSPYVQTEVREILRRPPVRSLLAPAFDPQEWLESIELVAANVVEHSHGPRVVAADPDDDPYLWTAYVGAATHVVTWDAEVLATKHFHGAQIVDPARFLRELRTRGSFSAEAGGSRRQARRAPALPRGHPPPPR